MTAAVHHLPVDAFAAARAVLRAPPETTSRDQITAACNRLAASHHWQDIELVRQMRNALWTAPHPAPRFGPPAPLAVPTIPVSDAIPRPAPARRPVARPQVKREPHPDLTGFLAGCAVLMLALFIVTAGVTHIRDKAAATVAQSILWGAM